MPIDASAILRTPDERVAAIPGFPHQPRHLDVGGMRIGFVDEGPSDGTPVLLVHGWPTWSFLWREVIPPLAAAGFRVVAPDLLGFGRSDKLAGRGDLSLPDQELALRGVVSTLGLRDVTLVCHDWGGMIALRVAAAQPDRFAAVVAVNALLPTGEEAPGDRFLAWQQSTQDGETWSAGTIVAQGCRRRLPEEAADGYDAPFAGADNLDAAARAFPMLIPTRPGSPDSDANLAAWAVFRSWDKPFLTLWSDDHPVVGGGDRFWREAVPGAAEQRHVILPEAGFYLAEERPELIVETVLAIRRR